jgi:hypothetical protein
VTVLACRWVFEKLLNCPGMKKIHYLFLLMFLSPALLQAQASQWVALRLSGQIINNTAVEEYIENLLLTDAMKVALFSLAQGDFSKYQIEKQQWIQRNFERGLKTIAYVSVMQGLAGVQFQPLDPSKILHDKENEVLKSYLQKGMGIKLSRIKFAEDKMQNRYPHAPNQDPEQFYWQWYDQELKRITEQLRLQALMGWMRYRGLQDMQKADSMKVPAFLEETQKEINLAFEKPIYNQQKIKEILGKNPQFHALIKSAEIPDLSALGLSELIKQSPNFARAIDTELAGQFSKTFSDKIINWENLAKNYSEKYANAEDLRKYARQALDEFFSKGQVEQFILSRLLTLAIILVENKNEANARVGLAANIETATQKFAHSLTDAKAFIAQYGDEKLEVALISHFRNQFSSLTSESLYLREFTDFMASMVRIQASKFLAAHQLPAQIQYHDKKDPQFYTRVMKMMNISHLRQALVKLHDEEFGWRATSVGLEVFPKSDEKLTKQGAWKYSLDNQIYKELLEESL